MKVRSRARQTSPQQLVPLEYLVPLALLDTLNCPSPHDVPIHRLRRRRKFPLLLASVDLSRLRPDQVVTLELSHLLDVLRPKRLCNLMRRPPSHRKLRLVDLENIVHVRVVVPLGWLELRCECWWCARAYEQCNEGERCCERGGEGGAASWRGREGRHGCAWGGSTRYEGDRTQSKQQIEPVNKPKDESCGSV